MGVQLSPVGPGGSRVCAPLEVEKGCNDRWSAPGFQEESEWRMGEGSALSEVLGDLTSPCCGAAGKRPGLPDVTLSPTDLFQDPSALENEDMAGKPIHLLVPRMACGFTACNLSHGRCGAFIMALLSGKYNLGTLVGTGTGPVHFQKVQHYAFISPEFFLTSLHSTPPFPGLQRVLLGIERGGLLGRSKGGTGKGVSLSSTVPSGKRDERGGPGSRPPGSKARR